MENQQKEKIPVLGSWPKWYWFVAIVNLIILAIFIIMTLKYNHI